MLLVYLQTRKCQNIQILMKIVNIEEENFNIFWTTWGISMKFSGKVCLIIILSHKKAVLYPLSGKCFEKTLSRLYLFTYLFIYLFIYLSIYLFKNIYAGCIYIMSMEWNQWFTYTQIYTYIRTSVKIQLLLSMCFLYIKDEIS